MSAGKSRRTLISVAWGVFCIVLLSSCVQGPVPANTSKPSNSILTGPAVVETSTPALPPQIVQVPIVFSCNDVLSPQDLYDFNPNFLFDESLVQATGPGVEYAKTYSGLLCTYLNETSRESVTVSITQFNKEGLNVFKEQAKFAASESVEVGKTIAYFSSSNGLGILEFVTDKYFVTLASPQYSTGVDGEKFLSIVKNKLP